MRTSYRFLATVAALCFIACLSGQLRDNVSPLNPDLATGTVAVAATANAPRADAPARSPNDKGAANEETTTDQVMNPGTRLPTGRAFCFAPGTPPEVVAQFYLDHPELSPGGTGEGPRYVVDERWPGSQGDPQALTWSLVPDDLYINESPTPGYSQLFARLDAQFAGVGGRAVWISKIESCFARWQALTGLTYTRKTDGTHDWDDGGPWGSAGGTARGDIRICMITIDGPDNVLGFSYVPSAGGDMVLDYSENWAQTADDFRFLRNVVMHEHGHGIGLGHICPAIGLWLMEPIINLNIDGPQHDDIRGAQRSYGDPYEIDNTSTTATDLGTLSNGSDVTLGPVSDPDVPNGSILSIDADGEVDWFKFAVTSPMVLLYVTLVPKGLTYDSNPQWPGEDCPSGNPVNSLAIANLNFQVIGTDGTTVLATAASQPAGSVETLSDFVLGAAGMYYIKVYEGDAPSQSQLYWLSVQISNDIWPPLPNPPEWIQPPTPASTTSITMTAHADDPSGVEYYFNGVGLGAHSSGWQASPSFLDGSLGVNLNYCYQVKARDQSPQHNETEYTPPYCAATMIETPAGLSFGTVTDTSIQVNALGTFTRLNQVLSGLYFEVTTCDGTPVGSGTGINCWTQQSLSQTATATGLSPCTPYRFRVKARNRYGINETPWYPATGYSERATYGYGCCWKRGDVNQDGVVDGLDIDGFVRAKLGSAPLPGENPGCANYCGTLAEDIAAFIADLLGF